MQKILFLEFAELKQGDGLGPKFYPGKAYWLTPDQAVRWKAEGAAEDAPEDMPAENERGPMPLRADNVRIIRRKGKFHVLGPDDQQFNDAPLSAHEAEKLRQSLLAGGIVPPAPASAAPTSAPALLTDADDVAAPVFELVTAGGKVSVYVLAAWPDRAVFAAAFLQKQFGSENAIATSDGSDLKITVANGSAVYTLEGIRADGASIGRLSPGSIFTEVPAANPT